VKVFKSTQFFMRDWMKTKKKLKPETEMRKWKRLNQMVKRKNRFSQAQIEQWKKEQEDQEQRDAWLTESEEAIKRHMRDL
ncbi:hypothetical protein, partial [Proteus mirabilis]|uniref:hypothetical protein n=2 Tax=Enterobacterales TaxID=91347 RepID=UPI003D28D687